MSEAGEKQEWRVVEAPTYVGVAHGFGIFAGEGREWWLALTSDREMAERIVKLPEFESLTSTVERYREDFKDIRESAEELAARLTEQWGGHEFDEIAGAKGPEMGCSICYVMTAAFKLFRSIEAKAAALLAEKGVTQT